MFNSRKILLLPLVIVGLAVFFVLFQTWLSRMASEKVTDFVSCANAGYPIMESYPPRCSTPDGRTFTAQIIDDGGISMPSEVTLTGELTCLPHKDQTGPQTLECAFGLKADDGNYYSLRDTDPNYQNLMQPTGVPVTVNGMLTVTYDEKYDSVGLIEVKSIKPIE